MAEITLGECIMAITAILSVFAASVSAFAAMKANSTAKQALKFQHQLKQNSLLLMKNEVLLERFQSVIATFAQIQSVASENWSDERSNKLRELNKKFRRECSIVKSLNPEVKSELKQWEESKSENIESIPYVLGMVLDSGAEIGNKYDDFFAVKSSKLNKIQDLIFERLE